MAKATGTIDFSSAPAQFAKLTLDDGQGDGFSEVTFVITTTTGAGTDALSGSAALNDSNNLFNGNASKALTLYQNSSTNKSFMYISFGQDGQGAADFRDMATGGSTPLIYEFTDASGDVLNVTLVNESSGFTATVGSGTNSARKDSAGNYSINTNLNLTANNIAESLKLALNAAKSDGEIDITTATRDSSSFLNFRTEGTGTSDGPLKFRIKRASGSWAATAKPAAHISKDDHAGTGHRIADLSAPDEPVYSVRHAPSSGGSLDATEFASYFASTVNNLPIQITATVSGTEVSLENDVDGTSGNVTITTLGTINASISGMSGGSASGGGATVARTKINSSQLKIHVSGGLAATGSVGELALDISGSMALITSAQSSDLVAVHDGSAGQVKKISVANLIAAGVAGSDTQVQYNNGGVLGGAADLTFNDSTGDVTVGASTDDAKLFFRDSGIFLNSSADGQLDIDADGEIEMASAKLDVDMSSDFNIQGGAESTMKTTAGALLLDGGEGVTIKEGGTAVITIDTNRDVLFGSTGGSTSDPDVEFDGYVRFDGEAEFDAAAKFDGDVTLGDAAADTITVNGLLDSDLLPKSDGAKDLGSSTKEWKDLYIDGVAYIDSLQADQLGAALDANSQAITNINVDSGAIDGITLGTNSAVTEAVVTAFTASHAQITNLDVVTINSVSQTETVLEVSDKLIVSALSASSANSAGGGLKIGGSSTSNGHASMLWDHANSALDLNIGGTTQIRLADGVLRPETDNDVDLGASGAEFKDLYLDGVAYIDELQADQLGANLDANSKNITGVGDFTVTGDVTLTGASDTAIAVGSDSLYFKDADGTMHSDSIADIATAMAGSGLAASGGQFSVDLAEVTAAVVDVAADSILIIDADDSNATKKESVADLASGMAGAGIGVSSGVLSLDIDELSALGGTGVAQGDHFVFSDDGTEKKITFSNMEDAIFGNVSGQAAIAAGGALSLDVSAITGQTEMTGDVADADELMISDGGVLKRLDFSVLRDAVFNDVSGDAAIADGGALTIQNDAVESGMLNDNVISGQTELASDGLAAADEMMISDAGVLKKIGVDNLFKDGPGLLSAATVAVADDHIMFLDGGATGDAKTESIADLVAGVAGNGLQASAGVLTVDVQKSTFLSSSMTTGATVATLPSDPVEDDSVMVYLNGILQTISGSAGSTFDYTLSGKVITMQSALDSDDVLVCQYIKQ